MIGKGFPLGRLFGIKINVDWSWLFIFLLVTWNLVAVFGNVNPDWNFVFQLGLALIAAILFFGSVLAHELAHSLMAIAQELPVRSITLFLFGGVSNIEREPPSPRAEFLITIVGPLTSLVLGVLFIAVSGASLFFGDAPLDPARLLSDINPLTFLFLWLGTINVMLGVFNLIPGFPLDGGRVLRSIIWALSGSLRTATRWASWVGQTVAWLLVIAGVAMIFGASIPFFGSGPVSGIWLAFIGWFLRNASIQSYRNVVVQDLLEDVPVHRLMRRDPPIVSPQSTVAQLVYDGVMGTDDHAFPVVDEGKLAGIVCLHDIRAIERERWPNVTVAEIMTPYAELKTVPADEDAADALTELQRQDVRQLPVTENGRVVGLLRRADVIRWLQLQGEERP